jgi:rhodanese-related sulfurtransferase
MTERAMHACCCPGAVALDWPLGALLRRFGWSDTEKEPHMGQTITKSARDIVRSAREAVPEMSVEEALPLVGSETHVFVDLRDGTEQAKTGIIPGAVASSRGMMEFHIDPESPVHKPEFNQDKTYVFYCASGGRSALAAQVAMEMGLKPVVNLRGGVGAWTKAGGALE